jgi:uncharacterized protein (TIGR02594 family)
MMLLGYSWLGKETGPHMLLNLIAMYGIKEVPGSGDNPTLLAWAREVGLEHIYVHDAIPWCGLTQMVAAKRAGWEYNPKGNGLWAQNWLSWGTVQPIAMLGDILVFGRAGGGHVAQYVGEDDDNYHILGGNQMDQVNIERKAKSDLLGIRRAPWRVAQPGNVRVIRLSAGGAPVATKEE